MRPKSPLKVMALTKKGLFWQKTKVRRKLGIKVLSVETHLRSLVNVLQEAHLSIKAIDIILTFVA
jgi:hypothetical protein